MSRKTKNTFDPYVWSKKRINTLVGKIGIIKDDGLSLSPGQIWSLKKLLFLDYYVRAFVTIIRKNDFKNWYYVDTHSGTGLIGFEEQDLIKERFPGSPLVAAFRSPEYVFTHYFFSDIDDNSIISLKKRLQSIKPLTGEMDYTAQTMDFKKTVEFIESKKKFGNAFLIFVDPKGYSEIKWELMKKLLSISTADIVFTFMTYSIAFNKETALENPTTAQSFNDFFGNENWKTCEDGNALVELYCSQIRQFKKYVEVIPVFQTGERKLYDLIIATNSKGGSNVIGDARRIMEVTTTELFRDALKVVTGKTTEITQFFGNSDQKI